MTIPLRIDATVPAYPLGNPADRPRYGMTPDQAKLYRWLVKNKPHEHLFMMDFRTIAEEIDLRLFSVHSAAQQLVDRGWIEKAPNGPHTRYYFVEPVMHFKAKCP